MNEIVDLLSDPYMAYYIYPEPEIYANPNHISFSGVCGHNNNWEEQWKICCKGIKCRNLKNIRGENRDPIWCERYDDLDCSKVECSYPRYDIGFQKPGAELIQAGLILEDHKLLTYGRKVLNWGIYKQADEP